MGDKPPHFIQLIDLSCLKLLVYLLQVFRELHPNKGTRPRQVLHITTPAASRHVPPSAAVVVIPHDRLCRLHVLILRHAGLAPLLVG